MTDGPEWFAPKRYGFGSGLPISWQGWALTVAFGAVVAISTFLFRGHPLQLFAVLAPAILAFMLDLRTHHARWLALAMGRGRLADRQIVLLIDQSPFVEVGQHDPCRLFGKVGRA